VLFSGEHGFSSFFAYFYEQPQKALVHSTLDIPFKSIAMALKERQR
jgi:hypothetical protein